MEIENDRIDDTGFRDMKEFVDYASSRSMTSMYLSFKNLGLSHSQLAVMRKLHWSGPMAVGELSEHLEVSNAAMSQTLDKLVNEGLVAREESREDRRIKMHHVTDKGRELIMNAHNSRLIWLDELYERLDASERELAARAFAMLLTKKETQSC